MNWVLETIEDAVISSLETEEGPWLPDKFTVTIEDEAFQVLIVGLVNTNTGKPLEKSVKRIVLTIQGRKVVVRSDKDTSQDELVEASHSTH